VAASGVASEWRAWSCGAGESERRGAGRLCDAPLLSFSHDGRLVRVLSSHAVHASQLSTYQHVYSQCTTDSIDVWMAKYTCLRRTAVAEKRQAARRASKCQMYSIPISRKQTCWIAVPLQELVQVQQVCARAERGVVSVGEVACKAAGARLTVQSGFEDYQQSTEVSECEGASDSASGRGKRRCDEREWERWLMSAMGAAEEDSGHGWIYG
jgi:hypothetical protein